MIIYMIFFLLTNFFA